jgi:NADPH-ferrihemoprotein reductase
MKKCLKNKEERKVNGDIIVYGLGDSQYENYNAMGRFTKKTLTQLGGNEVFEYGESDHDYAKADIFSKYFEPWKKNLWHHLHQYYKQPTESPTASPS